MCSSAGRRAGCCAEEGTLHTSSWLKNQETAQEAAQQCHCSCRLLRRLGPALAGLDAPLQELLQGPSDLLDSTGSQLAPAVLLFDAAMLLVRACQKVGKHAGATAEDLLQLSCCTPLLLGTGRLVAEWAAKAARLSPSPDLVRSLLGDVVANQLDVLATLIDEMYRGGVLGSFAADTAPPQALLAWLRAVVAVQQSVPRCEWVEGECGMGDVGSGRKPVHF